jgi:hypothetical protein
MIELVEREALTYARECGMKGEIRMSEVKQEYFGWTIALQDEIGHSAHLRMNKEGKPQMWEMQ